MQAIHADANSANRGKARPARRGMRAILTLLLAWLAAAHAASAAPCAAEDFESRVSGDSECLLMRRYGSMEPATLFVWLHGNVSAGGPANAHFQIALKSAVKLAAQNVLAVALVRPGYPDGSGAYSSGSDNGRADNWQRASIAEIGTAIERLRLKYKPRTLVLVGHSGGAAIAAVLLGMKPQLAEAAILVACPCNLAAWRAGRGGLPWSSEDPLAWTDQVAASVRIIALTGSNDGTTAPALGRDYVERLRAREIDASFELVADAGHIDILKSSALAEATARMLHR